MRVLRDEGRHYGVCLACHIVFKLSYGGGDVLFGQVIWGRELKYSRLSGVWESHF